MIKEEALGVMDNIREKINELKFQAQVTPLGATCDNNLFFNTLRDIEDYLDTIDYANSNKALQQWVKGQEMLK